MEEASGRGSHSPPPSPNMSISEEEEQQQQRQRSNTYEEHDDDDRSEQSRGIVYYDSDDEPRSKRSKLNTKVDRLSDLPEALITHILSLMPVTDAVKTNLLSKQWSERHAWTSTPILMFPVPKYRTSSSRDYSKIVTAILMLHNAPKINKMSLPEIVSSRDRLHPSLDLWVQAAVLKRIEELVIEIADSIVPYMLPPTLLSCHTLKIFRLSALRVQLGSVISWKSLQNLTLSKVRNLNTDMISKIIEGSPALESLSLIDCDGFNRICVPCGSKLRVLVIDYRGNCGRNYEYDEENDDYATDDFLEISAPSIKAFEISGHLRYKDFRLMDVSSLVQATLRFSMSTSVRDHTGKTIDQVSRAKLRKCQWILLTLLHKLKHVEKLQIGTWFTQVLSTCEFKKMPAILLLKCKSLDLGTIYEENLPGIARLLRSLLYLERLTIDMDDYDHVSLVAINNKTEFSGFDGENYLESQGKGIEMLHLKVVEIKGLSGSVNFMLKVAEFVLKHAMVLEELIMRPREGVFRQYWVSNLRHERLFETMQKLLSYQRSSPQAKEPRWRFLILTDFELK